MSEWKRIFLNRIWLGTAALSLLFSLVIYATAQSSRVGSSVLAYREHTNQWTQILSVVSPEDGLALLERENQTLQGWNTARMLVQLEEWQGQIDEEILNRYREQYENLDEMLHAVRSETAPELDIAVQESVARWIDRLVYQMGYAEFVQSVSTQAAAIRRSPMFSDSNTFVYRNADRTEADYLSTTEIHLKLLPGDVIESVMENHVAMVFSLFLMMVTIALIVEPKRLGLEALEQSCASGRETLAGWRIGAVAVSAVVTTVLMQGGMFLLGMLLYQQPIALNAPVQSIPLLQHWAAPTTVGVFLLWYLLFSAAGLWAIGLLLWLVLSRMPSLPVGLTLCGGILFLEYNWIQRYGVNDALYPLSGFNLFRLLFPAEAAERYLNYNLFGFPVRERTALSIILATLILACSTMILLSVHFALGNRKNGTVAKAFYALANRVHLSCRPKPALVYEAKKLLLYSGGLLFLAIDISDGLNTESVSRSHLANNSDSRIYYYGPLNYSTSKMDVPVVMSENSSELSNYQNAVKYIELIKQYGLIPSVSTHDEDNGIVDPIEYLETRYPNKTIKNAGYYNIGDNSIYGYRIKEWNACAVYGVAAIIHYYLPSYSYNTIASHCEQIARDKGYATLEYNDDGELEWNYYIDLGNLAPFARECAAYYNLGKSISSSMLTWSTGTSEISNGRPILLSIWHSDQYEDHTVTAFAWTSFQIVEVDIYMNFFKVKAGRVAASRYVCYQTVTGSFITKFV